MTEALFILTTIFIAYVVYAIINEQKASVKTRMPAVKPETPLAKTETHPPAVAEAQHPIALTSGKPAAAPKPATSKTTSTRAAAKPAAPKTPAKPAAPAKPASAKKAATAPAKHAGLKNPQTGEVVTAYTNYRFTKRWIKEALVAEGLVDKVYSASELTPEIDAKIKEAIVKLEAMDKYKP